MDKRAEGHLMDKRDQIIALWHDGSKHAHDGAALGSPTCNCYDVADQLMSILAKW